MCDDRDRKKDVEQIIREEVQETVLEFKYMQDERAAGKRIIEEIGATDHWDAIHRLKAMVGTREEIIIEMEEVVAGHRSHSERLAAELAEMTIMRDAGVRQLRGAKHLMLIEARDLAANVMQTRTDKDRLIVKVIWALLNTCVAYPSVSDPGEIPF